MLPDQLYVHTVHNVDKGIARHTLLLRMKNVSYFEVGFQKRKNV